jgi:hypothetical protein
MAAKTANSLGLSKIVTKLPNNALLRKNQTSSYKAFSALLLKIAPACIMNAEIGSSEST